MLATMSEFIDPEVFSPQPGSGQAPANEVKSSEAAGTPEPSWEAIRDKCFADTRAAFEVGAKAFREFPAERLHHQVGGREAGK